MRKRRKLPGCGYIKGELSLSMLSSLSLSSLSTMVKS
jgi:hypothetical protein